MAAIEVSEHVAITLGVFETFDASQDCGADDEQSDSSYLACLEHYFPYLS